jgi:putative transposase
MPERKYEVKSHCRFYIKYHLVWIVKKRRQLLTDVVVVNRLVEILKQIGDENELPLEEVGCDGDHLHLFCQAYPDIKPQQVVKLFKGISARVLKQEFPNLVDQTYTSSLWGVGYYISTIGHKTNEEAVRKYIQQQGRHSNVESYKQLKIF